ncbi:aromatic acid exporter family protein [Streptomyces sp. NPDC088923]|uniref:FUSC family protein n=1 Tax=Streptomyces sp. NPDC088923 TaxID=3365913 RepID=UPI003817A5C3
MGPRDTGLWARKETAAVVATVRTVFRQPGPERDSVVQSLKAAGAAIAAWALAGWWLKAPMALLAPWTALALVDATVYRSLRAGFRQLAVILLGTLTAAAALSLTRGDTLAAMALALPPLVLAGTYRRLGTQGIYGATTALFVITATSASPAEIGHRLLETGIGAVIGIAVNAFVLPPVHLRNAGDQLLRLPRDTGRLLRDLAQGVRGEWTAEQALDWHDEARRVEETLRYVRDARQQAEESSRLNPGLRLRRARSAQPPAALDARWSAAVDHLRAVTRTLATLGQGDNPLRSPGNDFFADWARLAETLAVLCEREYEALARREPSAPYVLEPRAIPEEVREAYEVLDASFHALSGTGAVPAGELLAETRQLLRALLSEVPREVGR